MENRCSVIKNMSVFPNYGYSEEPKAYEKYLLPKLPLINSIGQNQQMSMNSSLLLPPIPILTFAHLAYPSTPKYAPGKDVDCFQTYPPLCNFNLKQVDKKSHVIIAPPPAASQPQPSTKKTKFDFSIEALTSKDSKKRNNESTNNCNNSSPDELDSSSLEESSVDDNNKDIVIKTETGTPASINNRGRPSADSIELLKKRSLQNPHRYSCSVCSRSFPRKKSLDTHRLTHSDIKPYACDFPGCHRKFKQSGQLKTHLRLHTGEKPFKCTYPLCDSAFTHANRKCPHHPDYPLRRTSIEAVPSKLYNNLCSDKYNDISNIEKVKNWFQKQYAEKETKISQNKENQPSLESLVEAGKLERNLLGKENQTTSSDENCKRLLSAVALVELRDQMKNANNKKDNFEKLFSLNISS